MINVRTTRGQTLPVKAEMLWWKTSVCKNVILKKQKNIHTVDLYHLVLLASNVAKVSENQADNCEFLSR